MKLSEILSKPIKLKGGGNINLRGLSKVIVDQYIDPDKISGNGIKTIEAISKAEYDALEIKDPETLYIVKDGVNVPENGVYIVYTDNSISNYDTRDGGKTPLGVLVKTYACTLILHPSEVNAKIWSANKLTAIAGVTTTESVDTAKVDYKGKENTAAVVASGLAGSAFYFATALGADWYLPACGEMEQIRLNATNINTALTLIGGNILSFGSNIYWSSTQVNKSSAWAYISNNNCEPLFKDNARTFCRAVCQLPITIKLYLGSDLIADSTIPDKVTELENRPAPVQPDWNQNDNTKLNYIKNKPTIGNPIIINSVQDEPSTNTIYISAIDATQIRLNFTVEGTYSPVYIYGGMLTLNSLFQLLMVLAEGDTIGYVISPTGTIFAVKIQEGPVYS